MSMYLIRLKTMSSARKANLRDISNQMEINTSLAVAASLGGGLFGDHCSPISDTSVISSMASASDHIDHVKTQLPYAIFLGIITTILYLIIGIFSY